MLATTAFAGWPKVSPPTGSTAAALKSIMESTSFVFPLSPTTSAADRQEPLRYFEDIVRRDRPILDLIDGIDAIVNPVLASHYGVPARTKPNPTTGSALTTHSPYGRGGLLPMAVFLTKNAPGLRTSPVKRGYWVVRRVLGEHIPAPPPEVPELPKDESKLGNLTLPQVLARHRALESRGVSSTV